MPEPINVTPEFARALDKIIAPASEAAQSAMTESINLSLAKGEVTDVQAIMGGLGAAHRLLAAHLAAVREAVEDGGLHVSALQHAMVDYEKVLLPELMAAVRACGFGAIASDGTNYMIVSEPEPEPEPQAKERPSENNPKPTKRDGIDDK